MGSVIITFIEMKVVIQSLYNCGDTNVSIRCPHCGHNGVFTILSHDILANQPQVYLGQRKCPNEACYGHVFFVKKSNNEIFTYPSETIPFEKSNIPDRILAAFEEAVKCHSNQCFIASAIMIRKTLEEICAHEESSGDNLKKRLINLGGKITIPKELIAGMDELRLLGNDAAHIEANTFEQVGKEEIEISLEFTKEFLKQLINMRIYWQNYVL